MANKKVKFELTAVDKTKAVFDKVTKGLKGVGSAAAGATKGVAAVGVAATATATALALVVDKSFQAIDAIGKTSTQTGIATNTLQAFYLAARESGTTIDGANTALIKFARSVGDAQRGVKTQTDLFRDLGVEIAHADGTMKSFDQILEETADGIMGLGDQTARATALANLFGRQGIVLTGAIKDLSEKGMKLFIQRAQDLGIVLSESVIRRTEEFNDAIGVIKMQLGSFVNNITTAFLPIFEDIRETISSKIQAMIDEAGGIDKLAAKMAKAVIDFVAKGIVALGQFADNFATTFRNAKIAVLDFANFALTLLMKILEDIPFADFTTSIAQLTGTITENALKIDRLALETTNYGEKAKQTADFVLKYKKEIDDLTNSTDNLSEANKKGANSYLNLGDKLAVFKAGLVETEEQLDKIAMDSMKKFEDSIVEGLKTGKLAFKDFATSVVEQLIRVAIQQMVIAKLLDPFRGFLGDIFPGAEKSVAKKPTAMPKKMVFEGGGFTGMGARAGGVDGKGGFPAILHPNETVIDHTKGQGMGATVNFNISTVDAAGFDQLLASRKGLITQIINNAMNNQGKMGIV